MGVAISWRTGGLTTFVHNNDYALEELDECFERNAEGMLKNMAVHELALAVTHYGPYMLRYCCVAVFSFFFATLLLSLSPIEN
eukprot:COSAG05_NODE_31_length_28416_cov_170.150652_7_plen_83_part_00